SFADSGVKIGPYGLKKNVSGWDIYTSDPQNRLMIAFSDGDTIKCWEKYQRKPSMWGKTFTMIALAPMDVEIDNH
ncbi:MAG: hypothetical protein PHE24_06355, partial [Patescibacteria group bacterium]|nr:hypothetical protein [Patescibacteria group bacterium]